MSEMSAGTSNMSCILLVVAPESQVRQCSRSRRVPTSRSNSRRVARQEPGAVARRPPPFWPTWPPRRYPGKRECVSQSSIVAYSRHSYPLAFNLMFTTCHHPCSPSTPSFPLSDASFPMHPLIPSACLQFRTVQQKTRRYPASLTAFLEPCRPHTSHRGHDRP